MTTSLQDPNQPAGAIVETYENGSALRNDGVELRPANENPWYVLATIYGEQKPDEFGMPEGWFDFDTGLVEKNRRVWNGWFCQKLSKDEISKLIENYDLSDKECKPLSETELEDIKTRFSKRMGDERDLPEREFIYGEESPPTSSEWWAEYFENLIFTNPVCFDGYIFDHKVTFKRSLFRDCASFSKAIFFEGASYEAVQFRGAANFDFCRFLNDDVVNGAVIEPEDETYYPSVIFESAVFSKDAVFRGAIFEGSATFSRVQFMGKANFSGASFDSVGFNSACFEDTVLFSKVHLQLYMLLAGNVPQRSSSNPGVTMFHAASDFSSATFKARTDFTDAKFETHVPEFHATSLYADTIFTLPATPTDNWPALPSSDKDGIMPADAQKRAYNRLRVFMNGAQMIDEEQFFHRQEMRCKRALAKGFYKPLFTVFEFLSDYGNSVARPLVGLLGVIVIGTVISGCYLIMQHAGNWGTAWGWSFSNVFPFLGVHDIYYGGGFAEKLPWWLKAIGGIQTFVSVILLFLLGLGLRNQFRLR